MNKKIEKLIFKKNISKFLNLDNLEKIRKKELNKISFLFNKRILLEYKRDLIKEWIKKEVRKEGEFKIYKFKQILKKLGFKDDLEFINIFYQIESKKFAQKRSIKSLETPYLGKLNDVEKFAYFEYRKVKLYKENELDDINFIIECKIFISKKEIVFWKDEKENLIIKKDEIQEVILDKNYLQIKSGGNSFYIKYELVEIIYISISRLFKKNSEILFKNNN